MGEPHTEGDVPGDFAAWSPSDLHELRSTNRCRQPVNVTDAASLSGGRHMITRRSLRVLFFSRVNSPPTVECNKYQLSQMDPRDALPHARRAVHRCGRSVSYTGQCGRSNVDCHNYCALSSTEYSRQFITPSFSTFEAQSLRQSYRRTCALLSVNTQFKKHSIGYTYWSKKASMPNSSLIHASVSVELRLV